ncbi:hypothetical protein [Dictyobacter formicarum]|uniref:Uncharacterized protein n=1 Tax=Dictyobacter formicarum TaxID=2778368 RepID=A0ABQ3VPZ3_9CHLR|nr:hypothetical protein [Dictyobacter formicarum]GHO87885.1 hypothetical protein KSZ_58910 [Dictyobacter formicarum]
MFKPELRRLAGCGESYSAQALLQAPPHIAPGNAVVVNGVTLTWPNVAAGSQDNYKTKGQTVPVTPVNGATTQAFLEGSS